MESNNQNIMPNRLDLNTKVSLMSAVIYGLQDGSMTVNDAVDKAFEIQSKVESRCRIIKAEAKEIRERKERNKV